MVSQCIDELYAPTFLIFCKSWPDDGLVRPKPGANNSNNKIKKAVLTDAGTYLISF